MSFDGTLKDLFPKYVLVDSEYLGIAQSSGIYSLLQATKMSDQKNTV